MVEEKMLLLLRQEGSANVLAVLAGSNCGWRNNGIG
jgi:hypothetical protein